MRDSAVITMSLVAVENRPDGSGIDFTATSVVGTCSAASMRSMHASPSRSTDTDLVGDTSGACSTVALSITSTRSVSVGLRLQPDSAASSSQAGRCASPAMVFRMIPSLCSAAAAWCRCVYLQTLITGPRTTIT